MRKAWFSAFNVGIFRIGTEWGWGGGTYVSCVPPSPVRSPVPSPRCILDTVNGIATGPTLPTVAAEAILNLFAKPFLYINLLRTFVIGIEILQQEQSRLTRNMPRTRNHTIQMSWRGSSDIKSPTWI